MCHHISNLQPSNHHFSIQQVTITPKQSAFLQQINYHISSQRTSTFLVMWGLDYFTPLRNVGNYRKKGIRKWMPGFYQVVRRRGFLVKTDRQSAHRATDNLLSADAVLQYSWEQMNKCTVHTQIIVYRSSTIIVLLWEPIDRVHTGAHTMYRLPDSTIYRGFWSIQHGVYEYQPSLPHDAI